MATNAQSKTTCSVGVFSLMVSGFDKSTQLGQRRRSDESELAIKLQFRSTLISSRLNV